MLREWPVEDGKSRPPGSDVARAPSLLAQADFLEEELQRTRHWPRLSHLMACGQLVCLKNAMAKLTLLRLRPSSSVFTWKLLNSLNRWLHMIMFRGERMQRKRHLEAEELRKELMEYAACQVKGVKL